MAIDESGLSGQALKNAQAYNRAMDKAAKSLEQQKKSFVERKMCDNEPFQPL